MQRLQGEFVPGPREADEPVDPLLSILELAELRDLRETLPLSTQAELSFDDMVVKVTSPEVTIPRRYPSAVREMTRLAGVDKLSCLGENGAAVAALASEENSAVEALRKFEVAHGRDALIIALKLQSRHPKLLETTVLDLAKTQGTQEEIFDPSTPFGQEEVGRIMLLDREVGDPMGQKFSKYLNWGWPFYGSIDATPLFISSIYKASKTNPSFLQQEYLTREGPPAQVSEAFDKSVVWLLQKLEENPEGLLEFHNSDPKGGISAQAWKDSAFAYVHADGSRANHNGGIASLEVQALAYDALYDAALHYSTAGRHEVAGMALEKAAHLREQVFTHFWIDDPKKGGFFALATDRDENGRLRPLQVRTSNMGHLLHSKLLDNVGDESVREKRDAVVRQLFSPELLHCSGIRTLASDEKAFRPGGYHTGSVWLWDSMHIADGLEKHGYSHLAWNIRSRVWETVDKTRQFPEFVRGEGIEPMLNQQEIYVWNKKHQLLHLFEQPPQEVQGWTVSGILAAKYAYSEYLEKREALPSSSLEQVILEKISA